MSERGPDGQDDMRRNRVGVIGSWIRQATLVFEFLAALGVFGFIGHQIDGRRGTQPWGLLGGLLIGMGAGLYLMLREVKRLQK